MISKFENNKYEEDQIQLILFDIDINGHLISANFFSKGKRSIDVIDTIFNLNTFKNMEYSPPNNEFEKDALRIASSIKNWIPGKYKRKNIIVQTRTHAYFSTDKSGKIIYQF